MQIITFVIRRRQWAPDGILVALLFIFQVTITGQFRAFTKFLTTIVKVSFPESIKGLETAVNAGL
jgi:hypothetical protein